jgi:choline kinase
LKAIILAAGRGSRMNQLTEERPKCLVELHGRPLLQWQIDSLNEASITDIAIVTGYEREQLQSWGLTEFHNPRWAETNMVSSLASASEWLEAEPCIVSYSDIVYDHSAVSMLEEADVTIAITYDPGWQAKWEKRFADPLEDAETFQLNADGVVTDIGQKPTTVDEVEGQYMGLLRIAPEGWNEMTRIISTLPPDQQDSVHMTGMLQHVIGQGRVKIAGLPYRGKWSEVDSESDLRVAEELM